MEIKIDIDRKNLKKGVSNLENRMHRMGQYLSELTGEKVVPSLHLGSTKDFNTYVIFKTL